MILLLQAWHEQFPTSDYCVYKRIGTIPQISVKWEPNLLSSMPQKLVLDLLSILTGEGKRKAGKVVEDKNKLKVN